jgi:hypothetical protein
MIPRKDRGTAIYIFTLLKNTDETLVDPDSISCTVYDPNGVAKVENQAMTKKETGKYFHIWQSNETDAAGDYTVKFKAVKDNYTSIEKCILFSLQ